MLPPYAIAMVVDVTGQFSPKVINDPSRESAVVSCATMTPALPLDFICWILGTVERNKLSVWAVQFYPDVAHLYLVTEFGETEIGTRAVDQLGLSSVKIQL